MRTRGQAYLSSRLEFLIGSKAMAHITHLPYSVVERAPVGKQLARIKEFESLRDFFTGPLVTIAFDLPFVVMFLTVITLVAGPVVLVPIGLIAVYGVLGLLTIPLMRQRVKLASVDRSERQSFVVETLAEMRGIKVMGAEDVWYERFRQMSAGSTLKTFQANYLTSVVQTASHMLMVLGGIGVLALSVMRIESGDMTMGALIATMALTWRVLAPIQSGFNMVARLEQVLLSIRQLNDLLRFRL
ncbi:MAG: ABC transporter transmembrane domain-containing protein, partial [Alphaproteobacteria bacterium]